MKIQIRHNIFETNSSSIHTLTISKDDVDMTNYIGTTLLFGSQPEDEYDKKYLENTVQKNIDDIFKYMCHQYNDDPLLVYMKSKKKIEDALSKYNIKCIFNYDLDSNHYYDGESLVFTEMFADDNENFEDELIKFIFNKDSEYDEVDRDHIYLYPEQYPKIHNKDKFIVYACSK